MDKTPDIVYSREFAVGNRGDADKIRRTYPDQKTNKIFLPSRS